MTSDEQNQFNQIKRIRTVMKKRIIDSGRLRIKKGSLGCGKKDGRFEICQWIDVEPYEGSLAASILFYEDARIDTRSGNLHPGRYGYVVFQKWNNLLTRPSPNIKIQFNHCNGIFVPFDKNHREETDICILGRIDEETIVEDIYTRFLKFLGIQ